MIGTIPVAAERLTCDTVESYAKYMSRTYGTRLHEKRDSQAMEAIAQLLSNAGIVASEEFLNEYATTIFADVYLNFVPGQLSFAEPDFVHRALVGQMEVIAHEHQHRVQELELGPTEFLMKYADTTGRALLEADAYRCSMEVVHMLTGRVVDPSVYSSKLVDYAIDEANIRLADRYLRSAAKMVESGHVYTEAALRTHGWLVDNDRMKLQPSMR